MANNVSPVCKWTCGPEDAPYEVHIGRYSAPRTGIKAELMSGTMLLNFKSVDAYVDPQRCVWKCNDLPEAAPLHTWLFRSINSKNAVLIGVSFSDLTLHVKYFSNFDDNKLKDHALVFDIANKDIDGNGTVTYQRIQKENPELYDGQAETGMIRFPSTGEERVVHIWGGVGQDGIADLRLVHTIDRRAAGAPKEALRLVPFNRATWLRQSDLTLNNRDLPLIDSSRPIEERINFFKSHDVVILGGRSGSAYTNVTLSAKIGIPDDFKGFMQGKNLQATRIEEIAEYIREQLFVVKDGENIVSQVTCRTRIQVKRMPNYNFGGHHGIHDSIRIHLSQSLLRDIFRTPWDMLVAFWEGLRDEDAPITHQLMHLNTEEMQHFVQETPARAPPFTPDQKKDIFKEFDRAVAAGACVNYYIAENRMTARFEVGGVVLTLRSGAASLGRKITELTNGRFLKMKEAPAQNPSDQRQRSASGVLKAASMSGSPRPGSLEMGSPQEEEKKSQ